MKSLSNPSIALNVYPNPASGNLFISFTTTESEDYNFMVVDMLGNVVANKKYVSTAGENMEDMDIDLISFPSL